MRGIRISESEWTVMLLLWDKSPQTAAEVCTQLGAERAWSDKTVRTLINRLVEKGALRCETRGKEYKFSPRVSREECIHEESQGFLARVFRGMTVPLLAHFIETNELSKNDIAELKRLIADKERQLHES